MSWQWRPELKYSGTRYMDYFTKFEGINAWLKSKHYVQTAFLPEGEKTPL
jgi:hypothetical protein